MTPIALIGLGKIALDQHVPAIAASLDWELAGTVSLEGEVPGVPAYASLEVLFAKRPDIQTLSLCVPPKPRFDLAAAALKAGRHLMLEKPPGATLGECVALEALAKAAGVALYATWHSRKAAAVPRARNWMRGKTLRKLDIVWQEDVRRWHPGQGWIWQTGGFGVFDPAINAFSIMTEILDGPVFVRHSRLDVPENCQMPIRGHVAFGHETGADITARLDFLKEGEQIWDMIITTDEGVLTLSNGGANLSIDGQELMGSDDLSLVGEYPILYAEMAGYVAQNEIDFDLSPMQLTQDALAYAERHRAPAFYE